MPGVVWAPVYAVYAVVLRMRKLYLPLSHPLASVVLFVQAEIEGLGFSMEAAEDAAMGSFTFQGETFDLTQASIPVPYLIQEGRHSLV